MPKNPAEKASTRNCKGTQQYKPRGTAGHNTSERASSSVWVKARAVACTCKQEGQSSVRLTKPDCMKQGMPNMYQSRLAMYCSCLFWAGSADSSSPSLPCLTCPVIYMPWVASFFAQSSSTTCSAPAYFLGVLHLKSLSLSCLTTSPTLLFPCFNDVKATASGGGRLL